MADQSDSFNGADNNERQFSRGEQPPKSGAFVTPAGSRYDGVIVASPLLL